MIHFQDFEIMSFRFKVQEAWVLKRVLGAMAGMGTTAALMEILPSGVLLRVKNLIHDVLALLRIRAAGFHHYSCDKSCVINVNVREFSTIINSAMDDEAISIFGEEPVDVVYFVFINQNCDESRNASMKASEASSEHWSNYDDSSHEFRVCIRSEDFGQILEQSKLNKEAIQITVMGTMVTLVSGSDIIILRKENQECMIESVPASLRHNLWVSPNHMESFHLALVLSGTVWIHDSYSRSRVPPFFEFPLGELGNLLIYLPQPFVIS